MGDDGSVSEADASIHVRAARSEDESALAGLEAVAWSPRSAFPSVFLSTGTAFFTEGSPPDAHLVAEIDSAAVGYIRFRPASELPENAHVIEVCGLAVHPDARRRGVASALLAATERRVRAAGARKLSLRVLSTNWAAIRLYERFGFRQQGRLKDEFLIDGEYVDDVLMAKHLGDTR
jgi:ribosomal protein S18 acetylase RimI-like enzyme